MEKQKKIMLLGGIYYLKPAIEAAHKLGLYVITADYLPNNVAHQWSDEFVNVSIIDKEAVLKVAREKEVDGILSFAVDPGVVTAAYVAEQMELPSTCSYGSAQILQDKVLFRNFLRENGFNCPWSKGYGAIDSVLADAESFVFPLIVKPSDSAGSKGVSKVDCLGELKCALEYAFSESHNGKVIVEEFLEKDKFSSGAEAFVEDGRIASIGVYDQLFDAGSVNTFVPVAEIWPSSLSSQDLDYMTDELQRLISLLHMRSGLINVEFRKVKDGRIFLMEVSPRAGGNRLSELIRMATHVDYIEAEVAKAIGGNFDIKKVFFDGCYAVSVLHSNVDGILKSITIEENFAKSHVLELEVRTPVGSHVAKLSGANGALGTVFLKSDSREDLIKSLENQESWLSINYK